MKRTLLILICLLSLNFANAQDSSEVQFQLSPIIQQNIPQKQQADKPVHLLNNSDTLRQIQPEITQIIEPVREETEVKEETENTDIKSDTKNLSKKEAKKLKKEEKKAKKEAEKERKRSEKCDDFEMVEAVDPVREDTEHSVEPQIEEDFKVKHELLKMYEKKYDENNQDIENILKIARIHLDLGQRAIAKSYYMQLYNTYPNSPRIQFEMGKFYYECKQYNAALEFFKLSLASGNLRNIEVNEYTKKTYDKLGDEENAKLYEQIIEHLQGNQTTGE